MTKRRSRVSKARSPRRLKAGYIYGVGLYASDSQLKKAKSVLEDQAVLKGFQADEKKTALEKWLPDATVREGAINNQADIMFGPTYTVKKAQDNLEKLLSYAGSGIGSAVYNTAYVGYHTPGAIAKGASYVANSVNDYFTESKEAKIQRQQNSAIKAQDMFQNELCKRLLPKIRSALGDSFGRLTPYQETIYSNYAQYLNTIGGCSLKANNGSNLLPAVFMDKLNSELATLATNENYKVNPTAPPSSSSSSSSSSASSGASAAGVGLTNDEPNPYAYVPNPNQRQAPPNQPVFKAVNQLKQLLLNPNRKCFIAIPVGGYLEFPLFSLISFSLLNFREINQQVLFSLKTFGGISVEFYNANRPNDKTNLYIFNPNKEQGKNESLIIEEFSLDKDGTLYAIANNDNNLKTLIPAPQ